jgi:hypothetical protein
MKVRKHPVESGSGRLAFVVNQVSSDHAMSWSYRIWVRVFVIDFMGFKLLTKLTSQGIKARCRTAAIALEPQAEHL